SEAMVAAASSIASGQTQTSSGAAVTVSQSGVPNSASSETPAGRADNPNMIAQLLDAQRGLRVGGRSDPLPYLRPIFQVIMDPNIAGIVTAAALSSIVRLLEMGSKFAFLANPSVVAAIIDSVTRTRFTETDRDT